MSDREERFEKMLNTVLEQYEDTITKMSRLKEERKEKTVTYKQLMTTKLTLLNILSMYHTYGLIDEIKQ